MLHLSYTAWDLQPFANDEKAHGRYLTKDLVLAYLNAVSAGDLDTRVTA